MFGNDHEEENNIFYRVELIESSLMEKKKRLLSDEIKKQR
jgi:hypothetical protein